MYELELKQARRVLIYRLGSLGDTVVALPCLHLIARVFPSAERFMLTRLPVNHKAPSISLIMGDSGLISDYITYSLSIFDINSLYALRKKIRQCKPDVLVYLPGQRKFLRVMRDIIFFKSCGIKKIIGAPYSKDLRSNRLISDNLYFEHESSRLARCISRLGDVRLDETNSWDLLLSAEESLIAKQALTDWPGRERFIACSIGTKFEVNDWGNQNWQELLRQLSRKYPGYGLVLLGAPDEFNRSQELCASWTGPSLNLCGRISPRGAAAIIKSACLFLGHDSGPMHLAATVGISCVAIFSARTQPGVWFPYGLNHRVIYHKTECWGCMLSVCKKYHKKCINSITVSEVFAAICGVMEDGFVNRYHKS